MILLSQSRRSIEAKQKIHLTTIMSLSPSLSGEKPLINAEMERPTTHSILLETRASHMMILTEMRLL